MTYNEIEKILKKYGQSHLLQYYDELSESDKDKLLSSIQTCDFSVLENLSDGGVRKIGTLAAADALSIQEVERDRQKFEKVGIKAIQENKVAAILLAGGQGTRLGSNAPKGMFNIGETKVLTIFEQQMNNIKKVTEKAGVSFHIFVMTSAQNDEATRGFFKQNNWFGYDGDKIHFYIQKQSPVCDFSGKVFLEEKYKVASSPNGNGGWYESLIESGFGKLIKDEGIEWLNVYSVDNVLQAICDPVFIGATILSGLACSGKVVKKVSPEERVGVICKEDGKPAIIEYYEMPEELAKKRDEDGELTFRYGVTLNYLFSVEGLNRIYKNKLPYHLAKKAIPHIENGEKVTPSQPDGYKFETLAVDLIKLMGSCLAVEIDREKEFAPVKNKTGADSVESARILLKKNGVQL